jgi:hypothetical protein
MMTYNANIPQPTDQISDSQSDLLNNFGSINTFVNVNHVAFDDPNQGKHFFVEMPQQAGAPNTALGEVGLYCLASAYGANAPTLVYRQENKGTQIEIASANLAATGWTFLPSGLLVKWSSGNAVAVNGAGTILYPTGAAIPAFGTVFATYLMATGGNNNSILYVDTTNNTTQVGYFSQARYIGAPFVAFNLNYLTIGTL